MKIKVLTKIIVIILISALILSITTNLDPIVYANNDEVKVSVKSLNIRSGPGLTYGVTGSLKKDSTVSVIDQSGDWIKVLEGDKSGWVAAWFTEPVHGVKTNQPTIVSQVDRLNIRSQPSISSSVISQMSAGSKAISIREDGEWAEIEYNNITGWVYKKYISPIEETEKEQQSTQDVANQFEVSVSALNVRAKPDLTSKKVEVIHKGEAYKVIDQQHSWLQIEVNKTKGWVYSFHGELKEQSTISSETKEDTTGSTITILYNSTNLRSQPTTNSQVVYRANAGEQYAMTSVSNDWYEITLNDGSNAFVANWLVSTSNSDETKATIEQERKKGTLNGVKIVLDPGHGGNDEGTKGARGTQEKGITLLTTELLAEKLVAVGADVTITRNSDRYVDLRKRVSISHQVGADAFISIHYDATEDSSINGFTTYYLHNYQKKLAQAVHEGLGENINLRDRGVQPGNYLVLRENKQSAILIELGFLSNPAEERILTTNQYRDKAVTGIYNGLLSYFDDQLN